MNSARTNLRNGFISCLKEMTLAAGYNYDYRHVYDPPVNLEKMTEFPVINLLWGSERRTNTHLPGNDPQLDLALTLQIDAFLSDLDNPSLAIDRVIADVQKYFGKNFYVQPAGEDRTAFNTVYLSATPWGTEVETPSCGVSIEMEVWYSIRLTDPNTFV